MSLSLSIPASQAWSPPSPPPEQKNAPRRQPPSSMVIEFRFDKDTQARATQTPAGGARCARAAASGIGRL